MVKTRTIIITLLGLFIGTVACGYFVNAVNLHLADYLRTNDMNEFNDLTILFRVDTYTKGLIVLAIMVMLYSLTSSHSFSSSILKNKTNRIEAGLENARWLSKKEIDTIFEKKSFSDLVKSKKDGIPVTAVYNKMNRKLMVNFAKPMHTLILGATGSGKTTGFINPMIQILANSAAGSSMVCTDPKGELFQLHSKFLKERGYSVMLLDLRDCYNSYRWNPLTPIYRIYQQYINKADEIYKRTDSIDESGLTLKDKREEYNESEWYEFDGCAYATKKRLLDAVTVTRQKLYDEAYEDLNDIISIICPIESEKDPIWDRGARSMVFAIALAMLEDSEDPRLGMTEEKFNLFNINRALGKSEDSYAELRKYFSGRPELSKAVSMAKQVLTTAPETLASYMTNAYDKLSIFNDSGIASLTSGMDINLAEFGDKPCALFIKVPDEKDTRHRLAAMFMVSLYKALVKEASKHEDLSLPRNVYYLLDEFGNMPKISKFENMITVGRSRKIWFIIVVQAYAQLDAVYGEKVSEIVKGNCPYKVFIGSNDMKTCEEFSKSCGNMTVSTVSASKQMTSTANDVNVSQQTQQRPLIYPAELQQLNNSKTTGNVIVTTLGNNPLRGKFTPSYKCPLFKFGAITMGDAIENAFYEEEVYYDLSLRNVTVFDGDEVAKNDENVENAKGSEENGDKELNNVGSIIDDINMANDRLFDDIDLGDINFDDIDSFGDIDGLLEQDGMGMNAMYNSHMNGFNDAANNKVDDLNKFLIDDTIDGFNN